MLSQLASLARIDFRPEHGQPKAGRLALASVSAVIWSLGADALLVAVGESLDPGTRGYEHFQFSDYARLTVTGVVIACAAWPAVTRISSAPRWLFFRLAVLVTLALWLPDVYIWLLGQPAGAVAVLVLMHLAIALITYNLLVRLAPVTPESGRARGAVPGG